jgi:hypothetical protein
MDSNTQNTERVFWFLWKGKTDIKNQRTTPPIAGLSFRPESNRDHEITIGDSKRKICIRSNNQGRQLGLDLSQLSPSIHVGQSIARSLRGLDPLRIAHGAKEDQEESVREEGEREGKRCIAPHLTCHAAYCSQSQSGF